jgi:hypothetical protein
MNAAVQVFDEARTARLSLRYYERRCRRCRRAAFWTDLLILVSVSTVGAGIWLFPASWLGDVVTKSLAAVAMAASIYQLTKRPAEECAALEAHVAVYEQLDYSLARLVRRIKAGNWDDTVLAEMEQALGTAHSVRLRRLDTPDNERELEALYDQVNREIPPDYFAERLG